MSLIKLWSEYLHLDIMNIDCFTLDRMYRKQLVKKDNKIYQHIQQKNQYIYIYYINLHV